MIERVTRENLEQLLPLIAEYQAFYKAAHIDEAKNRAFFSRFVDENDRGVLHLYRENGVVTGFSTLYFNFSSTLAEAVAVLNDLYVSPQYRGKGHGRALLLHAAGVAGERGLPRLQWLTAGDNQAAQELYDSLDAQKSAWFLYTKKTQ